jgi:DinB superfamily
MSSAKAAVSAIPEARLLTRVLDEGYGPGAWHGPDLKAALADVSPEVAFWRPSPERHNVAEVALHHAYCAHSVRGQLSGTTPESFVLEGEDWFELSGPERLAWPQIQAAVEKEQSKLATVVADIAAGRTQSGVSEAERFNLVLGITCHAVYHAGQIQLLKRLHGA